MRREMKRIDPKVMKRVERLREERPVCRCLRRAVVWTAEGDPLCLVCANALIQMPRRSGEASYD
jgi:hypothetical protein